MSESIKLTLKVNEIVPDKEIIFFTLSALKPAEDTYRSATCGRRLFSSPFAILFICEHNINCRPLYRYMLWLDIYETRWIGNLLERLWSREKYIKSFLFCGHNVDCFARVSIMHPLYRVRGI